MKEELEDLKELKPDQEGFSGWYGKAVYFKANDVLSFFIGVYVLLNWRNDLLAKNSHLEIDLDTETYILRHKIYRESLGGSLDPIEEYGTIGIKFELKDRCTKP